MKLELLSFSSYVNITLMVNKSKPYKLKTIYTFNITIYIIVNPILNLLLNINM